MSATVPIPAFPGVTDEQVLKAMEIVARLYDDAGVNARLEPHVYHDPELPESTVLEIQAWIEPDIPRSVFRNLIRSVPAALREHGLYDPIIPLTTHPFVKW